jgi:hypothetical protein
VCAAQNKKQAYAANTAKGDFDENAAFAQARDRNLFNAYVAGSVEHGSFHGGHGLKTRDETMTTVE